MITKLQSTDSERLGKEKSEEMHGSPWEGTTGVTGRLEKDGRRQRKASCGGDRGKYGKKQLKPVGIHAVMWKPPGIYEGDHNEDS